jgi:hypothetical protein
MMTWRSLALILISLSLAPLAFAEGRIEVARGQFFTVAQRSYVETVKYLEANNTNEAKVQAKRLHDDLDRLEDTLLYIERFAKTEPWLTSRWETVIKLFGNLRGSTGLLEAKIGNANYSSELSTLKDYFQKFGDEFNKAYEDFKTFGKEFQTNCDTCR